MKHDLEAINAALGLGDEAWAPPGSIVEYNSNNYVVKKVYIIGLCVSAWLATEANPLYTPTAPPVSEWERP